MKIKEKMINWLQVLSEITEEDKPSNILSHYMKYPSTDKPLKYVIQIHTRGKSAHLDYRMENDDFLIGWTILTPGGLPINIESLDQLKEWYKPSKIDFSAQKKGEGFRAETKSAQPKEWIEVEGKTKKGQVGSTKNLPGVFLQLDKGQVIHGVKKPYFHEYFLKSSVGELFPKDTWTRVVCRAVQVPIQDPVTKELLEGTELMWRIMVPKDQQPYTISDRAMKRKWVPTKEYNTPFPVQWTKETFSTQYDKWLSWRKEENLASNNFTVQRVSRKGQTVVRDMPVTRWILRLKIDDKVHTWISDLDFTKFSPVAFEYTGTVKDEWFTYEGEIQPSTEYNPSKTLIAQMDIIDTGNVQIDKEVTEFGDVYHLDFKGKVLLGKGELKQEEKKATIYTFDKLYLLQKSLFSYQKHEVGESTHYDLRILNKFELSLEEDVSELEDKKVEAILFFNYKEDIPFTVTEKKKVTIGKLESFVTQMDTGTVTVMNYSPTYISLKLEGKKLNGFYVYLNKEEEGYFMKGKLPEPIIKEDSNKK